jgi:hypothetical protein
MALAEPRRFTSSPLQHVVEGRRDALLVLRGRVAARGGVAAVGQVPNLARLVAGRAVVTNPVAGATTAHVLVRDLPIVVAVAFDAPVVASRIDGSPDRPKLRAWRA